MFSRNWTKVILVFGLLTACQSERPVSPTPTEQLFSTPTQVFVDLPTPTDEPSDHISTPTPTRQIERGNSVHMRLGETVGFPEGVKVTFMEVFEDSRCPSDVTCVWAGRVTVGLLIEIDSQIPTNVLLSLGTLSEGYVNEILLGDIWITLISVRPHPISTISTQPEDYLIDLMIKKNDK